ncbi:NAD(P)/FAD-dependent oxidoreductase [Klebsiella pneumoniae]|nr:NAD(P)/FAD-dependent oxidoreductase [Klebsiella pneumoniae]
MERDEQGYRLQVNGETLVTKKLVIASGGLSDAGARRLAVWL